MKKLSKAELTKKGEGYLKASKAESILLTEDGSMFDLDREQAAINQANKLIRFGTEFTGEVITVKAPKAKTAAKAADKKPAEKKSK